MNIESVRARRNARKARIKIARIRHLAICERIVDMPFNKRVEVMLSVAAGRPRKGAVQLLKVARKGECALMRAADLAAGRPINSPSAFGNRAARRAHADRMYRFAV